MIFLNNNWKYLVNDAIGMLENCVKNISLHAEYIYTYLITLGNLLSHRKANMLNQLCIWISGAVQNMPNHFSFISFVCNEFPLISRFVYGRGILFNFIIKYDREKRLWRPWETFFWSRCFCLLLFAQSTRSRNITLHWLLNKSDNSFLFVAILVGYLKKLKKFFVLLSQNNSTISFIFHIFIHNWKKIYIWLCVLI